MGERESKSSLLHPPYQTMVSPKTYCLQRFKRQRSCGIKKEHNSFQRLTALAATAIVFLILTTANSGVTSTTLSVISPEAGSTPAFLEALWSSEQHGRQLRVQRVPKKQQTYYAHRSRYGNYTFYDTGQQDSSRNSSGAAHQTSTHIYYPYTRLSDVWLCLAIALGWTVWMLSSFVRSDVLRYQTDSVIVRGHVLSVSVEEDSLGIGIPTYKAIIDYMVADADSSVYQVRKHFETQHLLEEGFANVELLVLPTEPTHSVLREEWELQIEEQRQLIEEEKEGGMCSWMRDAWCRRFSMAFAGFLVLVSLAGCIQVVTRMDPITRWKGWLSVCCGATLLLPCGLLIHRIVQAVQRSLDFQSERAGIILKKDSTDDFGESFNPFSCEDMDVLDARACDEEADHLVTPTRMNQSQVGETAGCYFVKFPTVGKSENGEGRGENGSVSTVSSISLHGYSKDSGGGDDDDDHLNVNVQGHPEMYDERSQEPKIV